MSGALGSKQLNLTIRISIVNIRVLPPKICGEAEEGTSVLWCLALNLNQSKVKSLFNLSSLITNVISGAEAPLRNFKCLAFWGWDTPLGIDKLRRTCALLNAQANTHNSWPLCSGESYLSRTQFKTSCFNTWKRKCLSVCYRSKNQPSPEPARLHPRPPPRSLPACSARWCPSTRAFLGVWKLPVRKCKKAGVSLLPQTKRFPKASPLSSRWDPRGCASSLGLGLPQVWSSFLTMGLKGYASFLRVGCFSSSDERCFHGYTFSFLLGGPKTK